MAVAHDAADAIYTETASSQQDYGCPMPCQTYSYKLRTQNIHSNVVRSVWPAYMESLGKPGE